jgi:hypothetical protein
MPQDLSKMATNVGLACTATAVAGAVVGSLPIMGISLVGGLAATVAAFQGTSKGSAPRKSTRHVESTRAANRSEKCSASSAACDGAHAKIS